MRLPRDVSGAALAERLGVVWIQRDAQKGSHIRLTTLQNGEQHLTIPNHDPLRLGTLSGILKAVADHAGMSKTKSLKSFSADSGVECDRD